MGDGYLIQTYEKVCRKCEENNLELSVEGDFLRILDSKGISMGVLETFREAYFFLCGYERGLSVGRCESIKEFSK